MRQSCPVVDFLSLSKVTSSVFPEQLSYLLHCHRKRLFYDKQHGVETLCIDVELCCAFQAANFLELEMSPLNDPVYEEPGKQRSIENITAVKRSPKKPRESDVGKVKTNQKRFERAASAPSKP